MKWEERPGTQLKTLPSAYTVVTEVISLSHCQYTPFYGLNARTQLNVLSPINN